MAAFGREEVGIEGVGRVRSQQQFVDSWVLLLRAAVNGVITAWAKSVPCSLFSSLRGVALVRFLKPTSYPLHVIIFSSIMHIHFSVCISWFFVLHCIDVVAL